VPTENEPQLRRDEKELIGILRRLEGWVLVLVRRKRIRRVSKVGDEDLMWTVGGREGCAKVRQRRHEEKCN